MSIQVRFPERRKGAITLTEAMQRDGVYFFDLPAGERGPPCKTHLFMRFHNGTKKLELWIDDWEFSSVEPSTPTVIPKSQNPAEAVRDRC